ncbi:unnamed protein product, partial [Rotaria sp. Silwood1]
RATLRQLLTKRGDDDLLDRLDRLIVRGDRSPARRRVDDLLDRLSPYLGSRGGHAVRPVAPAARVGGDAGGAGFPGAADHAPVARDRPAADHAAARFFIGFLFLRRLVVGSWTK